MCEFEFGTWIAEEVNCRKRRAFCLFIGIRAAQSARTKNTNQKHEPIGSEYLRI